MPNNRTQLDWTKEEMVDWATSEILRAFGRGGELRSALHMIITQSAWWGVQQEAKKQLDKKGD